MTDTGCTLTLADLLDLPEHRGTPPQVTPRGRAVTDKLTALI